MIWKSSVSHRAVKCAQGRDPQGEEASTPHVPCPLRHFVDAAFSACHQHAFGRRWILPFRQQGDCAPVTKAKREVVGAAAPFSDVGIAPHAAWWM